MVACTQGTESIFSRIFSYPFKKKHTETIDTSDYFRTEEYIAYTGTETYKNRTATSCIWIGEYPEYEKTPNKRTKPKKRCKRKQKRKNRLPDLVQQDPGPESEYKKNKKIRIIAGIKKTKIVKPERIAIYNRKILN